MTGHIRIRHKHDSQRPRLIWLEPFGSPVYLQHGESLQIDLTCDESDVRSFEFEPHTFLEFATQNGVKATIWRGDDVKAIELTNSSQTNTQQASEEADDRPGLGRFINHLCESIVSTDDLYVASDCVTALSKINSPAAIHAMFRAYREVDEWCDDLVRLEILDRLPECDLYRDDNRAAALNYLDLLRAGLAEGSLQWPEQWGHRIRVLRWLEDDSPETLTQIGNIALEIAGAGNSTADDHEQWTLNHTGEIAIEALQSLAPSIVLKDKELSRLYFKAAYDDDDPIWFCNVCRWRFPRPKEPGFICDKCGAEAGVDDDHHYRPRRKNDE